jgi:signal transduction histidine kinase
VEAELKSCPDLSPEVSLGFYRIAQEALNNVAKHSEASRARVALEPAGSGDSFELRLTIEDDGTGFDPCAVSAGHLGLAIMRERAEAIGGHLEVVSNLGEGTRVTLTWRPASMAAQEGTREGGGLYAAAAGDPPAKGDPSATEGS